ncbi:BT_3987 domain-containing protein [Parapedobacter sp.]
MKRINQYMAPVFLLLLMGCSGDITIDEEMAALKGFGKVYIPQANYEPLVLNVTLTDEDFHIGYNAYYGGVKNAERPISVSFTPDESLVEPYNLQHDADYEFLPTASFSLSQTTASIDPGQRSTPVFDVVVKPVGQLEPFRPYLLPITLTAEGAPVNEALQTVYVEVIASFGPGEVPRQKVLSLGANQGELLVPFVEGQLIVRDAAGTLQLYTAHEGRFGDVRAIGQGWGIFDHIFYFAPNRMVGVAADVFQYQIDPMGTFGDSRTIGWGWNIFDRVIPYRHYLIGVRPDGLATAYPYNEFGDLDGGNIRDLAADWNRYIHLFAYGNSLLGIQDDGTLWQIPMDESGVPLQRVQLGSGWDMYESVIAMGDDLLAMDAEGDVWRYAFDARGFWPLKASQ